MATYLSWPEKLRYRALFTVHVLVSLGDIFDPWPGIDEPDTEAARCQQISENMTNCIVEMVKAEFTCQSHDAGMVVGESIGKDSILGWRAEGASAIMLDWTVAPMHVTRMLQERSAELQGLRIPRGWATEDGERFVAGFHELLVKSLEFVELGTRWKDADASGGVAEGAERILMGQEGVHFELTLRLGNMNQDQRADRSVPVTTLLPSQIQVFPDTVD